MYDEDVQDAPTFGRIAPGLLKWLHGCDLGGFNSNRFDVPMLAEEFLRVGIDFGIEGRNLVDVQNIFHKMEQRIPGGPQGALLRDKDLEGAHEALPDTLATVGGVSRATRSLRVQDSQRTVEERRWAPSCPTWMN